MAVVLKLTFEPYRTDFVCCAQSANKYIFTDLILHLA